jgi:hypothetical protein
MASFNCYLKVRCKEMQASEKMHKRGISGYSLVSAQTTDMLSEKTCTVDDCHDVPQMATAITTGTISFTAIYWWHQDDGHSTLNQHAESLTAPQPHDPDA